MPIYIDPRGPNKVIEDIEVDPNGGPMILTLVCGHRIERANQFSYLIGSDHVVKRVTNFSYKVGDVEKNDIGRNKTGKSAGSIAT